MRDNGVFFFKIASLARSVMIACNSLARPGQALPKYCTSMHACRSAVSCSASQPMVTPQAPQGFDRVRKLMPRG